MKHKKSIIGGIVVLAIIALVFAWHNLYRYPDMSRNISDNSLNNLQTEEVKNEKMNFSDKKILIAYFSWSTSGNTEKMASYIQEQTNGDLIKIEPLNPYPTDYEECGNVALVERDENVRPKIANLPDSIEEYDTIFIGYPIWWHTAPMIIGTFLENYDFSGKEVYPFTQSASMDTEQFNNSMEFVRESAVGANVHDGLFTEADNKNGILEYLMKYGFVGQRSDNYNEENTESKAGLNNTVESGGSNILIAYFSVMETDGVDTVAGASRVVVNGAVLGNNQYIAQIIQQETGGDMFSIETIQEYPTTHNPLLEFAYNEKADKARPALASHIENPDRYDVIFLGFPNWNADLPMPLYTFLEEYDFSGKTIIPFTTHGGSGFSRTIQTISELQPNATVISKGLSISRNNVSGAESDVIDWVKGLNLTTK